MALVRTNRPTIEALIGEPLEVGCGGSPFGGAWPCGCFAIPVGVGGVDWLPCPQHQAIAATLDADRLSELWESRLKL